MTRLLAAAAFIMTAAGPAAAHVAPSVHAHSDRGAALLIVAVCAALLLIWKLRP